MTTKQIEILNEMKEVSVGVYGGCLTVLMWEKTNTIFHNRDNTVSFDIQDFEVKGRSVKSIFKDLMTQIIPLIQEKFPESNEAGKIEWAKNEGTIYLLIITVVADIHTISDTSFNNKQDIITLVTACKTNDYGKQLF